MSVAQTTTEVVVTSGAQLVQLLSKIPGLQRVGREYKSSCPWCNPQPGQWEGDDRLVFFFHNKDGLLTTPHVWCRQAAGSDNHPATHSLEDLFMELGIRLVVPDWREVLADPALQKNIGASRSRGAARFETFESVMRYHVTGNHDYWRGMGFTDSTIRHFILGTGHVQVSSSRVWPHERGIVPVPMFNTADKYILKTRPMVPEDKSRHLAIAGQPATLFHTHLTTDHVTPSDSKTLFITEGERSHIAAWQMGFYPVASGSAGYALWYDQWTAMLLAMYEYDRIVFLPDNDPEGEEMIARVTRSLRSFQGNRELVIGRIAWPDKPAKYDVFDVLDEYGTEGGAGFLGSLVDEQAGVVTNERGGYLEKPDIKHVWPVPTPISELRGDGRLGLRTVIREYVDHYKTHHMPDGQPTLKLLRTSPGVGKSWAMVREAERLGRKRLEEKQTELDRHAARIADAEKALATARREGNLVEIDQLEDKLAALEKSPPKLFSVLYAGPFVAGWADVVQQGADMDLWYNFEGRNADNCENYDVAQALGEKGYNVMGTLCHTVCPFADKCRENGYLAQFRELRAKPIVYVRHQHLRVSDLVDAAKYVFVDEDPTRLVAQEMVLTEQDLIVNTDWAVIMQPEKFEAVEMLLSALREALKRAPRKSGFNDGSTIMSGRAALQHVDTVLAERNWTVTLSDLVHEIDDDTMDIIHNYLPPGVNDYATVLGLPRRGVAHLIGIVKYETASFYAPKTYVSERHIWNSRFHFNNGVIQIYPMESFSVRPTKPIVVADATANETMYELSFGRAVETYAPVVRDDRTKTVVFTGGEYTKTDLYDGLSTDPPRGWSEDQVAQLAAQVDVLRDQDLETVLFNLNFLDKRAHVVPNKHLEDVVTFIESLTKRHESLLVVTYIYAEQWLKSHLRLRIPTLYPKLRFGHYGGLRGTNVFKDIEAVLLVGTPRLSDEDMRLQLQAWYYADPEPLDLRISREPELYHGREDGYAVRTFADWRARDFVWVWEAAEMIQCAERIRPHTSTTGKYVYSLTARPAVRWVTQVKSRAQQLYEIVDEPDLIEQGRVVIDTYLSENPGKAKMPQRAFREALGISANRARKIYKSIMDDGGSS